MARRITSAPVFLPNQDAYLKAIDLHLKRLESASSGFERWVAVRDVLNWLYDIEHVARTVHGQKPWFAIRNATPEGQTFAALIWFRGQRVHLLADTREAAIVPMSALWRSYQERKAGVAKAQRSYPPWPQGGAGVAVPLRVWPDRRSLPDPDRKAHGCDRFYDQYVAGQSFVPPLRTARDYAASQQHLLQQPPTAS